MISIIVFYFTSFIYYYYTMLFNLGIIMNKMLITIMLMTTLLVIPSRSSYANMIKQCLVESGGNHKAKSKIGKIAVGYCQIRPKTFYYVVHKLLHSKKVYNINNKRDNVYIANYYMGYLASKFKGYTTSDKNKLVLASYNAGLNNVQKAIKQSKLKTYTGMINRLPNVTGARYAGITARYVGKVIG